MLGHVIFHPCDDNCYDEDEESDKEHHYHRRMLIRTNPALSMLNRIKHINQAIYSVMFNVYSPIFTFLVAIHTVFSNFYWQFYKAISLRMKVDSRRRHPFMNEPEGNSCLHMTCLHKKVMKVK